MPKTAVEPLSEQAVRAALVDLAHYGWVLLQHREWARQVLEAIERPERYRLVRVSGRWWKVEEVR